MRTLSTAAIEPLATESASNRLEPIAAAETYRISIRDLTVDWHIGVFDYEQNTVQPVLINVALVATALSDWNADDYAAVPCYSTLAEAIVALAAEGHVKLVETLAHRIAQLCLEDDRVLEASVKVEKPSALAAAAAVGVEVCLTRDR